MLLHLKKNWHAIENVPQSVSVKLWIVTHFNPRCFLIGSQIKMKTFFLFSLYLLHLCKHFPQETWKIALSWADILIIKTPTGKRWHFKSNYYYYIFLKKEKRSRICYYLIYRVELYQNVNGIKGNRKGFVSRKPSRVRKYSLLDVFHMHRQCKLNI